MEESIDFSAQLYKVPPDETALRKEKLLGFARLEEARHRRAEHLCGGMKKQPALACTLIYRPEVFFGRGRTLPSYCANDTPVILYCRSGNMSEQPIRALVGQGCTQVWDVPGGMAAWQDGGRELVDK